jgi:Branched-chain amino acid transport protein (AzlD)
VTAAWLTIGFLAAGTIAIKSVGPLALGGRELPVRLAGVVALLAPSLLAALVVVDTFAGEHRSLTVDERAGGLLAAGGALAARLPLFVVVLVAAAVTAGLRALV